MDPQRKLLFIALPWYSALMMMYTATRWHSAKNGLATFIGTVLALSVAVLAIELVLIRRSHRA